MKGCQFSILGFEQNRSSLIYFLKIFGGHKFFFGGPLIPYFGLLVMSALGFKARVDPSLAC